MAGSDWSFAHRPFWLFSHVFAVAVVVSFVGLGFWQLDRHDQRQEATRMVEERSRLEPVSVAEALASGLSPAELDYVAVADTGTYLAAEQVVVRNRSNGRVAGSWVLTPLRTDSGPTIMVNRGFLPDVVVEATAVPVPADPVEVSGWLRRSEERGPFGPVDPAEGRLAALARVDVARIAAQVPVPLAPVWLQLADQVPPPAASDPVPVPLPQLGGGAHLSYAMQWFTFAALGVVVYLLLLRRRAAEAALAEGPGAAEAALAQGSGAAEAALAQGPGAAEGGEWDRNGPGRRW
jgi:surfeit locus 1 family protein